MFKSKSILIALGLSLSSAAIALPDSIQFTNDTEIALNTSLAGLPGRGIEANVSKSVFLAILQFGCFQTGQQHNCPLEFFNRTTGEKVASVRMNVETLTLTAAPTIYGKYADSFYVSGWEASPITHIKISNKKT
jgi:hypothetical protein